MARSTPHSHWQLALWISVLTLAALVDACGNASDSEPNGAAGTGGNAGAGVGGDGGSTATGGGGGGMAGWVGEGGATTDSGAGGTSDAGADALDSGTGGSQDGGANCPAPTVYTHDGPFVPTQTVPTFVGKIAMPAGLTFAKIQVDIDFVRGPWASQAPSGGGISNIFWLHRGQVGKHWLNNVVGYMNFKGHSTFEVNDNLGITDPAIWNQRLNGKLVTTEGTEYHARYAYDAAGNKYWFRVTQAGQQLLYREGAPLLDTVDAADSWLKNGTTGFFVQIGNEEWDGTGGPEVATFGWVYSNLVIQFFPPCP